MADALIYSLAPLKLNATVLAIANLQLTPEVAADAFRHSGNEFASVMVAPGAAPRIRFKTPFLAAYNLIGLKTIKCTTVEVYLAKFVDAIRSASAVHRKYALAASATGFAYITGASVAQQGVLMADVEVILLSADGTTHPLAVTDNNALPTLASEPALHTLGPVTLNGTAIGGTSDCSVDLSQQMEVRSSDGDIYPRVCAYLGGSPSLSLGHDDPVTLLTTVGLVGLNVTANVVQYFRNYDTTTGLTASTGLSLTIASGRVIPESQDADNLAVAKTGMRVLPLSSTTTHPMVIATGATVPTP